MIPYSIYDYLTFIFPGLTVLFASSYGWFGWPWHEPGGATLVGIIAAGFIVGNVVTAAGSWLEPSFLGHLPGTTPDVLWGQFAKGDRHEGEKVAFEAVVKRRYGEGISLTAGYRLAQRELRNSNAGDDLKMLTQQIGFYRGMTVASLIALLIEAALASGWHTHLFPGIWLPVFATSTALFAYRFRRFWRWYGDTVLRGLQLL
ncbi:MAG: hypothetical protein ACYCR4_02630 [Acidimicrobiales bacterium]